MIHLFELIENKNILDKKINELKNILSNRQDNNIADELLLLIDQRLSKEIIISKAHETTTLNIGDNNVNLLQVRLFLNSLVDKIDILTSLINNNDCILDKLELMKQRDRFYEEYILLYMALNKAYIDHKI